MSEKLKALLEKINQEGVRQAEENARAIESKAKADAEKIVQDARSQAEKIIGDAKGSAIKTKRSGEIALKQASRDLILALKDETKKIFNKIVTDETVKVMSQKNMADILTALIENYVEKDGKTSDVKVLLKKEDLDNLRKTFISKLKDRLKKGIEFKPSPTIDAGFSISFDKGKSFFDFTDEGLTEALCAYLNPELARLLK